MEEKKVRQRAKSKKLRVTFPDGRVICYPRAVDTFVAVLREIGSERFPEITLEMSHLPLLSREIYPEFKNWMKPVCDGWYVNNQSSNDQKYMQLRSIGKSLDLGLTVELGEDFEPQQNPGKERTRKSKSKLSVRLGDADEWLCGANMQETFIMVIKEIETSYLGARNPRLHTDEVLVALSVLSPHSENARLALESLPKLRGCQIHTTVMLGEVDRKIYSRLGVGVTCDPTHKVRHS